MRRRRAFGRSRYPLLGLLSALLFVLLGPVPAGTAAASSWWDPVSRPAPDSQVNVAGAPFTGTDGQKRVRGWVDAHVHLMSNEGFGGRLVCGKAFSPAGAADALKDCPEHYPNGVLALFDMITKGGDGMHDPTGWPTFKDWPAHDSATHQQTYYAWVERAWRGGQRVLVNDMVTNGVICSMYFFKDRGCDEMSAIRLQIQKTRELQDFVDTMYGGPGKGWFRIVTDPGQAREVIQAGKLAVVLGVETSEPFGCKQVFDNARCTAADIERGLDELYDLGVRSMFLCHKFDNALCGVRFDTGTTGMAINAGQFLSTGTFWETEACTGPQHDNPIGFGLAAEDGYAVQTAGVPDDEARSRIQAALPAGTELPRYETSLQSQGQCNRRGLTSLGDYAVRGMVKRGMMLEVDHMSVKAADRALQIMEAERYAGVLSTHGWMDEGWTERVYQLGGFITGHMYEAPAFSAEARKYAALRAKYGAGYGIGTDMNGFASLPGPRAADGDPVRYPFRSPDGGSVLDRQVTGSRAWDVNTDGGGTHYGLVPDWIEDIRVSGGQDVVDELMRGAEGYLRTWQTSRQHTGAQYNACTTLADPAKDIAYQAHVADIGWQGFTGANGTTAGTTGLGESLEALRIRARGAGDLWVRAHVQNIGWQPWQHVADGQQAEVGTVGRHLRLEALEIRVGSGNVAGRGHVQGLGWTPPAAGPTITLGTTGRSLRLEALSLNLCV
ncbi:discoidin domain-containing protein [Streptomyces sp. IBSNAI002]|uniref:discoidin domain-containing protein n=1 Tax=Streptomyces sp. IBSNAI002 TaxID=3457500 RepID=UPI003FD43F41